jgi:hypothetical protein
LKFDEELERRIGEEFGDEATPEFLNMLMLGKAAYEHGHSGFIPKEKVIEWVGRMYNGGQQQREIMEGKSHGMISINSGDVINSGSYLSLHGKKEGYLSGKKPEQS